MNRFKLTFRNSLASKVIVTTLLLSLGVIFLTGSALYSRLSEGIRQGNLDTSLAEARSSFFNAQYQFLLAQGKTDSEIKAVVNDVVVTSTSVGVNQGGKSIVLMRIPNRASLRPENIKNLYDTISPGLSTTTVPLALRDKVESSFIVEYQYADLEFADGKTESSLFTGKRIDIPNSGIYEMYLIYSLSNQAATLDFIRTALLITGFALTFLIGLITYLVVRQVVRPVRDAARIAQQFTKGDFSQRMKIQTSDELATLGTAFNEMALSLESQISRLENLSRVQQRFVSDVSHELRTPLTTLRMASEVIYGERETFEPTTMRSTELLVAQLDRFEKLLEDLLEISRFDAEVAVLEPVNFDFVTMVERCIEEAGARSHVGGLILHMEPSIKELQIKADIRRVERIMRNLLSNALDHAEDKPIVVTIVGTATEVAVGVRDYGPGLESSSLLRVFDRFWRADPSRSRVRGGTGLGLSIALEDARLHNGELEAWGRPGQGTHFVLTLPIIAGESISSRPLKLQPLDFIKS
jgi:two-component system sensor histidine kinase MtrB